MYQAYYRIIAKWKEINSINTSNLHILLIIRICTCLGIWWIVAQHQLITIKIEKSIQIYLEVWTHLTQTQKIMKKIWITSLYYFKNRHWPMKKMPYEIQWEIHKNSYTSKKLLCNGKSRLLNNMITISLRENQWGITITKMKGILIKNN